MLRTRCDRLIDALADVPDDGDVGLVHDDLGGGLDAHVPDGRGGRADEDDALLLAEVGELDVLREEAITRVDGLRPGLLGGLDDPVLPQVGLLGGGGTCKGQ